jgi:tetratricopeptide (TPR) repeat protein
LDRFVSSNHPISALIDGTELAKYDRASHAFNQAEQYFKRLQANFKDKGDEALFEKRQRNIFCMLVWQAQTHLALHQSEAALRLIFQAKGLLGDLPAEVRTLPLYDLISTQVEYLSLNVCYNGALQNIQLNRYTDARRLLEVAISVYELSTDRSNESEARLLRQLANVLLHLEDYDKALKCAQLSTEVVP